jgi:hypothetical protein
MCVCVCERVRKKTSTIPQQCTLGSPMSTYNALPPFSLSLSLHCTLIHTITLFLPPFHTHTRTLIHIQICSLTHTHVHSHSLSLTHTQIHTLSLFLSPTHTHKHTHFLSFYFAHTHNSSSLSSLLVILLFTK